MTHPAHATEDASAVGTFEVVVFDHDGVLVDSEIIAMDILAQMVTAHGIPTTTDQAINQFLGTSIDAVIDHVRTVDAQVDADVFIDRFNTDLFDGFRDRLVPIPGMHELLQGLRNRNIPVVVASSGSQERVALGLSCSDLAQHFTTDRITTRDDVRRGKPAPDIFLTAAVKEGIDPSRCIVIEDSPHGVEAAHRAGMRVIGLAHRTPAHRLANADWVVDDAVGIQQILLGTP